MDGVGQLIEGINALEAALNSNRVKKVYLFNSSKNTSQKLKQLIEKIEKKNLEIEVVKDPKKWNFHSRHNIVGICIDKKIYNETNFEKVLKNKNILTNIQTTNCGTPCGFASVATPSPIKFTKINIQGATPTKQPII